MQTTLYKSLKQFVVKMENEEKGLMGLPILPKMVRYAKTLLLGVCKEKSS